ncbi:MAG TPA: sigma-70 family RNA polymerase sigma factor [Candidatus Angelobacter sp.]
MNDPILRSKPDGDANENLAQHSSKASEAADLDLVRQLQAGNHDALTPLFEKYSRMVFFIARRILRDDAEAEEVVQQVFLDAYRAINQFDERKGSFKTWLFCYSYNRTLDRKRHLASKGFHLRLQEQELQMVGYEGAGRRIRLCSQEVAQLVEQLLKSIQPRQRTAIELTFFDGLTAEEIAHKTGETAAVVRHNLYRGLSKLRATLIGREDCAKPSPAREVERIVLDPARLL